MDKRMQEQMRRIMKKHGLRDKYENLIKSTRTTVEAWFGWVEGIYAVSRLHPYVTNEKDKPKFLQADKEWLEYVVNEDKCAVLSDYVAKYTKPVVIQAIHYLMDNQLWEAPLGIEGIRKANADLYKGVKAIDEAVAFLRSEGKIVDTEEVKPAPVEKPEAETTKPNAEKVTGLRTDAFQTFASFKSMFGQLHSQLDKLGKYFQQEDLVELLEQDNTRLETENKKLAKDADRLTESIKIVNHQLSDAKKEIERQKQIAYDAATEKNRQIDNFNKLKKQYEEMKEEYDYLKREAKKALDTPVAKIIPLSKLRDIPLVGAGVLKGLIPLLRKYNIVVDENK